MLRYIMMYLDQFSIKFLNRLVLSLASVLFQFSTVLFKFLRVFLRFSGSEEYL